MTTIAVDSDLNMSSDSQMTDGGDRVSVNCKKIWHVHGHTIGVCGAYGRALAFLEALEDMLERKSLQEGTFAEIPQGLFTDGELDAFNAIVIDPEGNLQVFEGDRFSIPVEAPFCLGSGAAYAYGALHAGADSGQAIQAAIKYDVYSGGDVVTINHKATLEANKPLTKEDLQGMTKKKIIETICG